MPNYIPNAQSLMRDWLVNFAALISAAPATYGLVAGDATTIQNSVNAFDAALTLAIDPVTRSPTTIADKDAQRMSTLGIVRPYAQLIRNNAGVTDENKVALGLTIVDRNPTVIPAPTTIPVMALTMATPLQQTFQFADANTPMSKAKPFGSIGIEIAAVTSATAITDPDVIPAKKLVTKSPFVLDWESSDQGKLAYIVGRYYTRRGLVGPWSAILSAYVA